MEKFDIVLENVYYKAKTAILEEASSKEDAARADLILTEAATNLQKIKEFVKQNKGKLGALAAAALAGGAGYAALGEEGRKQLSGAVSNSVEAAKQYLKGNEAASGALGHVAKYQLGQAVEAAKENIGGLFGGVPKS